MFVTYPCHQHNIQFSARTSEMAVLLSCPSTFSHYIAFRRKFLSLACYATKLTFVLCIITSLSGPYVTNAGGDIKLKQRSTVTSSLLMVTDSTPTCITSLPTYWGRVYEEVLGDVHLYKVTCLVV